MFLFFKYLYNSERSKNYYDFEYLIICMDIVFFYGKWIISEKLSLSGKLKLKFDLVTSQFILKWKVWLNFGQSFTLLFCGLIYCYIFPLWALLPLLYY